MLARARRELEFLGQGCERTHESEHAARAADAAVLLRVRTRHPDVADDLARIAAGVCRMRFSGELSCRIEELVDGVGQMLRIPTRTRVALRGAVARAARELGA